MMKKQNSLTEGAIVKGLVAFAIPLLLGQLFQQLYNMADSLIVGNYLGSAALAAVTSTGSLILLFIGFFNGVSVGAGVVIAKYYGAKDEKRLRIAIHTNLAFGVVCGLLVTVLGLSFTPQILKLMGTPADVMDGAVKYLRVYFAGALGVVLYNTCRGSLQAVGDSRSPLYYLMASSIVNIVLDIVFCGKFGLGVEYAALATIISQFLSVFLCIRKMMRMEDACRLYLKEVKLDFKMLKKIIRIGLPSGVQNSITSIANVVVQSNINAFGKMAMAGCGAHAKIEGFGFLPVMCFSMALTTFVGQNMGAGKYDRVKKGTVFGIGCMMGLAELVGIVMYLFAPQFISMFDKNAEVIAFGTLNSRTVALFYFLMAFSHGVAAVMRGVGKSAVPMLVVMISWCAIRIAYISVVTQFFDNIQVVLWAYPITWAISSCIFLGYLWKGNWLGMSK